MIGNTFVRVTVAALLVGAAAIVGSPSWANQADSGRPFSERDARGPYGFSFDGFLVVTVGGQPVSLPVAAVGQLNADGRGNIGELVRTLSIGGLVILEQVATGTYRVDPDGTGFAEFTVVTTGAEVVSPLPPGVSLPGTTLETFSFVLNRPHNEIQFIGRTIRNGEDPQMAPVGAGTVRGVARRQ